MLFQKAPLPPRAEYFIDCALECDEMNAFAHAAVMLLGDRDTIARIIDAERAPLGHLRSRQAACLDLDSYAHQMVSDLVQHEQEAFASVALFREPIRLLRIAEYLAHYNHEDQTTGGAGLPYRRTRRCDRDYDPTPRARRHLYSPSAIRRYAALEDQSIPLARKLANGLRARALPADISGMDLISDLLQEQFQHHRTERVAARAEFDAEQRAKWGIKPPGLAIGQRKAVRRAAAFASGIIGADQVSALIHGKSITLPGKTMAIEVAKRSSVADIGHGALEVRLCSPEGARLANVCVYFDKMPVLDQVAAIAMLIATGDEASVIETGNLFGITAAGARHPLVTERLAKNPKGVETSRAVEPNEWQRKLAAQRRYQADVLHIYFDATSTLVWGRDKRLLAPFSDAVCAEAERLNDQRATA